MKKLRLDEVLLSKGLVPDKNGAFIIVTEGKIFVDGQKAVSPSQRISPDAEVVLTYTDEYVGRGAFKLEGAVREFNISVEGKICADLGAATGGFTEVLLRHGAKKVYAIDTARGKLALKLREDPRVIVMEDANILYLETLPELIDLATIDVSFTSLRLALPAILKFLAPGAEVIALFKPQYETRNPELLKHGIVRDDASREALLKEFEAWAVENSWKVLGTMQSPIKGSKGNTEYLLWMKRA